LKPFIKLAKSITAHHGIENSLTRGRMHSWESVNTKITSDHPARLRLSRPDPLIALAMRSLGGLCPPLPGRA